MENNSRKIQPEYTVDVIHVLKCLWKRAWIIILAAVLVAGAAFVYSSEFQTPQYSAKVQLMVKNATKAESEDVKYDLSLTASELAAAQSLVVTYKEILVGGTTMNQVIGLINERYEVPEEEAYTPEKLASMIEVEPVEETALLAITVTADNPKNAAIIANCIAEVLPLRVTDETLDLKPLAVVDLADEDAVKQVAPNPTSTAVKGGAIGAILAVLVLAVIAVIDGSIHDEDYILKTYNYPVLAKVPVITPAAATKNSADGKTEKTEKTEKK